MRVKADLDNGYWPLIYKKNSKELPLVDALQNNKTAVLFLGLREPDPDPLVRGMDPDPDPALDPDPSIIKQI
jgi:hypothetical protein